MKDNNSYFGGIVSGIKTLATGLKVTMKEYVTPKSTEQYPENRKTTLHVAKRHRGRLVFKRDEAGNSLCTACPWNDWLVEFDKKANGHVTNLTTNRPDLMVTNAADLFSAHQAVINVQGTCPEEYEFAHFGQTGKGHT